MDRVDRRRLLAAPPRPGPGFRGRPWSVLMLVVACGVVVCMLLATRGPRPAPGGGRRDPGTVLTARGDSLLPAEGSPGPVDLRRSVGQPVEVRAVWVLSAPTGDGFWIGTDDADRLWVELTGPDASVYPADGALVVDLDAVVVTSTAAFLAGLGLSASEGAARLERSGAHLVASRADVRADEAD